MYGAAARAAGASAYPVHHFAELGLQPQLVGLAVSDTSVARQLLARHDNQRIHKQNRAKLHRPSAISRMLEHSLTASPPSEWHRQRQAVKIAVGSTLSTARAFQPHGAHCCVKLGDTLRSRLAEIGPPELSGLPLVDLRQPIYHAAAHLLCGIILGPGQTANAAAEALVELKLGTARQSTAKKRAKYEASRCKRLEALVRSVQSRLHQQPRPPLQVPRSDGHDAAVPLIQRLATATPATRRTGSDDGGRDGRTAAAAAAAPLLSSDEVVHNVHSFMLAGFETTAVLVLFTLLHLAHDPAAQTSCAAEACATETTTTAASHEARLSSSTEKQGLVEAALKETLRLYPPVATLPRVVHAEEGIVIPAPSNRYGVESDGVESAESPRSGGDRSVVVPKGQTLNFCVGAAARSGWARPAHWDARRFFVPTGHGSSTDTDDEEDDSSDAESTTGDVIAFGLGPRACPAGSLSLLMATQLTCAVLTAVELGPPPGRPADGLKSFQGDGGEATRVEYYWEEHTRLKPVLALISEANVTIGPRRR
jgi:cytochrome P450